MQNRSSGFHSLSRRNARSIAIPVCSSSSASS